MHLCLSTLPWLEDSFHFTQREYLSLFSVLLESITPAPPFSTFNLDVTMLLWTYFTHVLHRVAFGGLCAACIVKLRCLNSETPELPCSCMGSPDDDFPLHSCPSHLPNAVKTPFIFLHSLVGERTCYLQWQACLYPLMLNNNSDTLNRQIEYRGSEHLVSGLQWKRNS